METSNKIIAQQVLDIKEDYETYTTEYRQSERNAPYTQKIEFVYTATDSLVHFLELLKIKSGDIAKTVKPGTEEECQEIAKLVNSIPINLLNKYTDTFYTLVTIHEYDKIKVNKVQHWNSIDYEAEITSLEMLKTMLSVIQNNLLLNERGLITRIRLEGSAMVRHIDDVMVAAIPKRRFVIPGTHLTASIFVGVYNMTINPTITINKGFITKTEYAVGSWEREKSPLGLNTVTGTATIKIDARTVTRPFSFDYFVVAPGISINLDKAKVCYIGVNNPITVSVPGYEDEKLTLKVKGAKVTKRAAGKFNIFFNTKPTEDVYAFVEGTNSEGSTSTVASLPLKVIALPTPIATIDGAEDGHIPLRSFRNAEGLYAIAKDSDFDMPYTIVSYKLSLFHKNNSVYIEPVKGKGRAFSNSPAVLKIQNIARRGDRAIFEDIVAIDENGRTIELAPLILKLD